MKKKSSVLLLALVLVLGVTMISSMAAETTAEGHKNHCICGANLADSVAVTQHGECSAVVGWTPMTTANMKKGGLVAAGTIKSGCLQFKESGSYYLTEDIALSAPLEIAPGQEITICLSGHVLSIDNKYSVIYAQGGILNICDCTGKGAISNTYSTSPTNGGAIYLYTENADSNGTVVNMYGGSIKDSKASSYGGNVRIHDGKKAVKAEFNLYGGTISGGSAKRGGNVFLYSGDQNGKYAVLNIYGGSIVNGTVSGTGDYNNRGGNIYALRGQIHMYSGAVAGGVCQTDTQTNSKPFGADICLSKNSGTLLELNGKVSVGDVAVGGGQSTAIALGENFETDQPIQLNIVPEYKYLYLVTGANESHLDDFVFIGNMPGYKMALTDDNCLMLVEAPEELGHCYCGGAAEKTEGHTCDMSVAWENWDGTTELVSGGRYHLTDTDGDGIVTVSNTIELADQSVSICLDGLQLKSNTQLFLLSGAAQLNICDCKGKGSISGGEGVDHGGTVYVSEGCTFQLFGGAVTGGKAGTYGGNIYCAGTANLYGGTITEGFAGKHGGNIYVSDTGVLNLAGATVSNGSVNTNASNTYGGNIYAAALAQVSMSGGSVEDGNARAGGNILMKGDFTMSGGTISGGKALATGGNIRVDGDKATLHIIGGEILNGESGSQGGNFYFYEAPAEMLIENALISGGVSATSGGNFYIPAATAKVTMNNCRILDGESAGYGGNIYAVNPEVVLNGCAVSGGVTVKRGANIYTVATSLTLDHCQVTNGAVLGVRDDNGELTETPYGYNIFFNNGSGGPISLAVNGGTISGEGQGNAGLHSFSIFPTGKAVDIQFGGELTIDYLFVGRNRQITIENLAETASIGMVAQEPPALFAPDAQAYVHNFYSVDEENMVMATDEGLVFTSAVPYWAYTAGGATIGGYGTLEEAAAAEGCAYVRLAQDRNAQGETFNGTVCLDLNGFDLSGLVVNGTIYGTDTKTANYTSTSCGKLNVTLGEGSIAPYYTLGEDLYLTLKDGEAYTFHKAGVEITHLSLDTNTAGFGYKAKFMINPQGAALMDQQIVSYGFYMGVSEDNMKTYEQPGNKAEFTLRLNHILTEDGEKNAEFAAMDIIAIPFVKIPMGEQTLELTGKTKTENMVGCVKAVEQVTLYNSASLTTEQTLAFQRFCKKYADVVDPFVKETPVLESGDKIIFFGNSLIFYGKCVIEASNSDLPQSSSKRNNDQGYFYQICKANGLEVSVTNYTFGNHTLKDFYSGNCQAGRGHDGADHMANLTDFDYDYVVFTDGHTKDVVDLLAECAPLMDVFRQGNPNVQFVFLVHHLAYRSDMYSKNDDSMLMPHLPSLKQLDEAGIIVVDWGQLVADVIASGKVPGGTMAYNQWSFIVNKSKTDGYHENILSGYITAQMLYCAITGESAVGQYYGFWNDTSVNAKFDLQAYMDKYYVYQTDANATNFIDIFNSPTEMRALQELMDKYLAEKAYLEY